MSHSPTQTSQSLILGSLNDPQIAANAVMAGCEPRMFRIVVSAVEAMLKHEFGCHGWAATTMGATPMVIVNGPVRHEAGLNSAHGALQGAGSRSNVCIGRAVKLVLQNVGGAKLGGTESSTIGNPCKISLCVAEREESLEGDFEAYHVTKGFQATDSVVTLITAATGPTQLVDFFAKDASTVLDLLGAQMAQTMSHNIAQINDCILVLCPEHQTTLIRGGITSKAALQQALWSRVNLRYSPFVSSTLYNVLMMDFSLPWLLAWLLSSLIGLFVSLLALLRCPLSKSLVKFLSPASFHIILAGADAGKFSAFMPSFGIGEAPRATAHMSSPVHCRVGPAPAIAPRWPPMEPEQNPSILVDPRVAVQPSKLRLAPRPGSTAGFPVGCTIGLMDISKTNGSKLLDQIEANFCSKYRGVEVKDSMKLSHNSNATQFPTLTLTLSWGR